MVERRFVTCLIENGFVEQCSVAHKAQTDWRCQGVDIEQAGDLDPLGLSGYQKADIPGVQIAQYLGIDARHSKCQICREVLQLSYRFFLEGCVDTDLEDPQQRLAKRLVRVSTRVIVPTLVEIDQCSEGRIRLCTIDRPFVQERLQAPP